MSTLRCFLTLLGLLLASGPVVAGSAHIDLTVVLKRGRFAAAPGDSLHGWLVVANRGNAPIPGGVATPGESYSVELVLSSDRELPQRSAEGADVYREDMLATGGHLARTPTLGPGAEDVLEFTVEVPAGLPERAYLCARIDPGNRIVESNDDNNDHCARLERADIEPKKGRMRSERPKQQAAQGGRSETASSREPVPGRYERRHPVRISGINGWIERRARDTLRLQLGADGSWGFELEMVADNGHTCAMEGRASHRDGYLEYSEHIAELDQSCVLRLDYQGAAVILRDEGQRCRNWYCGPRGRIDGARFERVTQ